jgi:hypothetical protein
VCPCRRVLRETACSIGPCLNLLSVLFGSRRETMSRIIISLLRRGSSLLPSFNACPSDVGSVAPSLPSRSPSSLLLLPCPLWFASLRPRSFLGGRASRPRAGRKRRATPKHPREARTALRPGQSGAGVGCSHFGCLEQCHRDAVFLTLPACLSVATALVAAVLRCLCHLLLSFGFILLLSFPPLPLCFRFLFSVPCLFHHGCGPRWPT